MSVLESGGLELVIITYHDDFLKVAEIKEGVDSLYERLAAVVWLSPDDLKLLGLDEGKPVELRNAIGSIVVHAKSNSRVKSGTGHMPFSLYSIRLTSYEPAKSKLPNFKRIDVIAGLASRDITPIAELEGGKLA
jgi:formylmethanofuran dehydrogenase subunit D